MSLTNLSQITSLSPSHFTDTPPVYDISQLEKQFDNLGCIGGGGEGVVYWIKEKTNEQEYALKILCNNIRISPDNQKVAKIISEILNDGISPHLTKICSLMSVKCLLGDIHNPKEPTKFLSKNIGLEKKPFPRRAYLMEKLDGDLASVWKKLSQNQELALTIQIASIQFILTEKNVISMESGKYRNILIKKLDVNDVFRGQVLQNFDFWKYVFGKYSFYLPKPEYLIKLGDYDPWSIAQKPIKQSPPAECLQPYLSYEYKDLSLEDIAEKFKKPTDPHAQIIEIYP